MLLICSPDEMRLWSRRRRSQGRSVALVPTMGFFHEGHLSLMRRARALADAVVVSIFVNPIQFGPQEDFTAYPRDFGRDERLARDEKIDVIFCPKREEMYPDGHQTRVRVKELSKGLCGASRPGHFEGVATVVAKLFNIVIPDRAFFGEKDFQQLAVIKRMTRDLGWDIEIVGCPTVREADGLAMSSRNSYLTSEERHAAAPCLWKAIGLAREKVAGGEVDTASLGREIRSFLEGFPGVAVEYVQLVDRDSLLAQEAVTAGTRLVMAVKVGRTRLIDNAEVITITG